MYLPLILVILDCVVNTITSSQLCSFLIIKFCIPPASSLSSSWLLSNYKWAKNTRRAWLHYSSLDFLSLWPTSPPSDILNHHSLFSWPYALPLSTVACYYNFGAISVQCHFFIQSWKSAFVHNMFLVDRIHHVHE